MLNPRTVKSDYFLRSLIALGAIKRSVEGRRGRGRRTGECVAGVFMLLLEIIQSRNSWCWFFFSPCMDNKSKKMALDIEKHGYCC